MKEQEQLTETMKRICHIIGVDGANLMDRDMAGCLSAFIETPEQEEMLLTFLEANQENLTESIIAKEIMRKVDATDPQTPESEDYISPETEFSDL